MRNSNPRQLFLAFADSPRGGEAEAPMDESTGATVPPQTARSTGRKETRPTAADRKCGLFDEVACLERLEVALKLVARNKGAAGVDEQSVEEVVAEKATVLPKLVRALQSGSYRPGDVRRVWIRKTSGGQRGLGIPNVVDRVVQQAVKQVLEPLYEPTFHASSHGFRPGRSCHTAIAVAAVLVTEEQRRWLVDIDLKSFFDRVNHQRLLARLALRVEDRRLLRLIAKMLKAKVVLPDGVRVSTEMGVPQGGPLSPLLSNIVLDELDWELERRGLRFVRYADDCNIYVRSERAGLRVMDSIRRFLRDRMRLEVNEEKSAVARPWTRHFLGFRVGGTRKGRSVIHLSRRTLDRFETRIRAITRRNAGRPLKRVIEEVNGYLRGWMAFFHPCTRDVLRTLRYFDGHIRRRLRAIVVRQKKRPGSLTRHLRALGLPPHRKVGGGGPWAKSRSSAMHTIYTIARFEKLGLLSVETLWRSHAERAAAGPAACGTPG